MVFEHESRNRSVGVLERRSVGTLKRGLLVRFKPNHLITPIPLLAHSIAPVTPLLRYAITPLVRAPDSRTRMSTDTKRGVLAQNFIHNSRPNKPFLVWLARITGDVAGAFVPKGEIKCFGDIGSRVQG